MPHPKPVLAVFASFSGSGGVERMLVNLIRGLVDLGQPVELLLVRAEGPHLERLPPEVRQIRLGVDHTQLAIPALARYLRRRRPAALLAAKDRAGRAAVIARALAGTDTRLVLRLGTHLSTAMAERDALARWLRYAPIRVLYPRLDGIVAVSEGVAADTARIARLEPARIGVIRNPVITPELAEQAAAPCPHPWLADAAPPVILGAGRLQRQKDFPTLLRAFARVHAERPECRLMILGEGGGRARLERLARELGIGAAVALPGFQHNPYAFIARARQFVLSSAWEGSPNVLTEALALGVPSVATDCPSGPRELLDGGRYGPLVAVGDDQALARAMTATLDAPLPPATLRRAVAAYRQERSAAHYLEVLGLAG
ncbi:glycosyltransferase [Marichromatium gracile]|uniref:Glycosyltransferase involved in cell wall biosynthesis n=1 Tax=Marichromatium gracile TaxID=1048 RepID=A0A4V2WAN9_MARGR|nr:glycosyltransferase [Marichromatium gracile]MBK1707658.1 glycosyl transferase [Marichromatium gracile]TCW40010.1 glycosyltransferase involved in cell wall biosynthesis [Marichromatium gracile]